MTTIGDCYDELIEFGEMLQVITDMRKAAQIQKRLIAALPKQASKELMMALTATLTAVMEKCVPEIAHER